MIITKNKENETENDYLALGVTLLGCIIFLSCNNGFSCCTNDAKCVNANNADSIQVEMMVHQIWYDLNAKIGNGDACSFTPYQKQVYEVSYVKMAKKVKKVEGKSNSTWT